MGPRAGLDAGARRKILCPRRGSNLDRPARSQTLNCLSYRGSSVEKPFHKFWASNFYSNGNNSNSIECRFMPTGLRQQRAALTGGALDLNVLISNPVLQYTSEHHQLYNLPILTHHCGSVYSELVV
jgi:hypothetical protein